MKLLVLLFLLSMGCAFANTCVPNGTIVITFPGVAGNWSSCGGVTPQVTDSVNINNGSRITISGAVTLVSITVNSAGAQVLFAASSNLTCTSTNVCLVATLGCTAIGGNCLSAYIADSSAAGAGTEVTITDTSLTSGTVVAHSSASPGSINLQHAIISGGSSGGAPLLFLGDGSASTLTLQNSHLIGGATQLDVQFASTLHVDSNLFDSGTVTAISLHGGPPTTCTMSNNHETGNTNNTGAYAITSATSTGLAPCNLTGNTLFGSTTSHSFIGGGTAAAVATEMSYNIAFSQCGAQTATFCFGIVPPVGITTAHSQADHNIAQGFDQNFQVSGSGSFYIDFNDNISIAPAAIGAQQGAFFIDGSQLITFLRDIALFDPVLNGNTGGNIGFFLIGNEGTGGTGSDTVTNPTVYLPTDVSSSNVGGIHWADNSIANAGVQTPSFQIGAVIVGAPYNMLNNGGTFNTFSANGSCPSSVGVCYNVVYAPGKGNTASPGGDSTNWDDGVNLHFTGTLGGVANCQYAFYKDCVRNPFPFNGPLNARTFADIDRLLFGGAGSTSHLFGSTCLGGRWNGGNDSRCTPQNVYNMMHASTAPQDVTFATLGPGGGLAGATSPVNIMAVTVVP